MAQPHPLHEALHSISAVGHPRAKLLARLGLRTAGDLLFFFPRSYQEPATRLRPDQFVDKARVAVVGTVLEIGERVTQSGKHMLGVLVAPEADPPTTATVRLLWFNQPYRKQDLRVGQRLLATGVLRSTVLNWEIVQPQMTLIGEEETPDNQRPTPIYALTEGLKQVGLRGMIREVVPGLIPHVEEALPDPVRERLDVTDIRTALSDIHFPATREAADTARRRFKLQELLVLQLALAMQRRERERGVRAFECEPTGKIHARILNRLAHELTCDQQTAVADIGRDMARCVPMNRLLQGDVGSGKTLVAQYAMLLCVAHGYQAALMAPTEVLAQQHAATLEKSLAASRVRVALLTGSLSRSRRQELLSRLADGQIDLLVGTQALLADEVRFQQLALVIVDEQHKFGVLQRARLRTEQSQPHYLVLSATPIPRTIAMTLFGDLDVSTIRSKPPGRSTVHTYTTTAEHLPSWWKFVERQLEQGRQAYVIAPRVAEVDNAEVASATSVFAELQAGPFRKWTLGLLHGRLHPQEKEETLRRFADGQLQVLVATTVVEVGIDIPNACVMTILDANRLGLSQLHQLRGRISRGAYPGYACAVAAVGAEAGDNQRLQAFEKSNDGFELAEMDLAQRGPGDLLGTAQSGLPPLRIANLAEDGPLVELARSVAREILQSDPELQDPQLSRLVQQTLRRYGTALQLSDVG